MGPAGSENNESQKISTVGKKKLFFITVVPSGILFVWCGKHNSPVFTGHGFHLLLDIKYLLHGWLICCNRSKFCAVEMDNYHFKAKHIMF